MYIICREQMSEYKKVVFIEIEDKYISVLPFAKVELLGTSNNINWDKKLGSNGSVKEKIFLPSNLFTLNQWQKNLPNWKQEYFGYNNDKYFAIYYPTVAAMNLDENKLNLLFELFDWLENKNNISYKEKWKNDLIKSEGFFLDLVKKPDFLSLLSIYDILG